MSKRVKFQPKPVSQAIGAFGLLLAATATQAGPGFGDAYDLNNNPFVIGTYFAGSPAGPRQWKDVNADGSTTGATDSLTGAPEGYDPANRLAYKASVAAKFPGGYPGTGKALRKFVDPLPLPGKANAKLMADGTTSKHIPVAVASKWVNAQGATTTDDYYEIAVVEFSDRFHSDLRKPTTLRGYVQIDHLASNGRGLLPGSDAVPLTYPNGQPIMIAGTDAKGKLNGTQVQALAVEAPRYLGPVIAATKDTPTRVKFLNLLPVGRAVTNVDGTVTRNGDLFLPVDPSIVGGGFGPDGEHLYTQNRVSLHMHGGDTPWISDGTPHQWITPAGEADANNPASVAGDVTLDPFLVPNFLRGPSAVNVPDMNDPGPGAQTLYFPNGQSARMMWYHDHAIGITRLNVMAGMASAYLLTDSVETALVNGGTVTDAGGASVALAAVLPSAADTIPLVLQDKTFVPDDIALQDARWHTTAWGAPGDMWYPHVYETVQDTNQATNFNAVGRWHYGPQFWPSFPALYALPSGGYQDVTTVPEAWGDTPLVNGVAYPTLTVDPKPYRFKILNAANDRFFTFNMFEADYSAAAQAVSIDGSPVASNTEVKMVPIQPWATYPGSTGLCAAGVTKSDGACVPDVWSTDFYGHNGGVPDPLTQGPTFFQIASEGGLLPGVAAKDSMPIGYLLDKGRFAVLNIDYPTTGLHIANAERADIVVDFTCYAGRTLLVYNDSGAPAPAADPRNEYFTNYGDNSATGGSEDTRAGYGPNTRTMMQIVVNGTRAASRVGCVGALDGNAAAIQTLDDNIKLAYKASQETPIVAQSAYNGVYGKGWDDSKAFASIFVGSLNEPLFNFVPGDLNPAAFNSVIVGAKGSGYIRPPAVTVTGTGTGASAVATLKIDKLHVINAGSGFKNAPAVRISSNGGGNGTEATSSLKITAVQVVAGGSGYSQGQVQGLTVTSGGLYTPGVASISLNNATANRYRTGTPTVTITGGGGSGATAVAVMTGTGGQRRIASITVTNAGSGYTSLPTVTVSAPTGAGGVLATATAATAVVAPTVTFPTPAGGAAATATVQMTAGQVTGLTLTNAGRGYASAPVATFVGGSVTTAATAQATSVTALPTVTFPRPLNPVLLADGITRGTGVTATGIAQVSATGAITGVTITNPGSGYTIAPTPAVTGTQGTGARLASTGSIYELMMAIVDPNNPDTAGGGGYDDLSTLASEPGNLRPGLNVAVTAPTEPGSVTPTFGATGKVFDITLTTRGSGYTGTTSIGVAAPVANAVLAAASTFPQATLAAATAQTDTAAGPAKGSMLVKTKAIQELFEPTYGRLNATLGIELPFTSQLTQTTIPLGYVDAPTESFADGETQIWKITQNGVDVHPVHFHLLNVQVINRVGWDNFVDPPQLNELGWKETVKMAPLEDTVVAVRAKKPKLGGFGVPTSYRLLDPTQPEGAMTGFTQIDPATGVKSPQANRWQDFGWEYVWHCHILGHEENDFMRAVVFNANEAVPAAPTGLAALQNGADVDLTWADVSTTEFQYRVERAAPGTGVWQSVGNLLANSTMFTDTTAGANASYDYRVVATGQAGESVSNVATVMALPSAPGNLVAANTTAPTAVTLTWDASTAATDYLVQRAAAGSGAWDTGVVVAGNLTTFVDTTVAAATAYDYQVTARNSAGNAVSTIATVTTPTAVVTLPTPAVLATNGTNGGAINLTVRWPSVTGATEYDVQWSTSANMSNPTVLTNVATTVFFGLRNYPLAPAVAAGTRVYVQVRATATGGASNWSAVRNAIAR